MKKYVLILLSIAIIYSCSDGGLIGHEEGIEVFEAGKSNTGYDLSIADTLSIPVDSLTKPVNLVNSFVRNDDFSLLIDYNENRHSIQFYSLLTKRKVKEIFLKNEGPLRIGNVTGIVFNTFDSIFLVVEGENRIALIDTAGSVLDQWKIDDYLTDFGEGGYDIYISEFFKPYYNKEKKQLTVGLVTYLEANKIESYTFPLLADFDITKTKVTSNYAYNPKEFMGDEIFFLMDEFNTVHNEDYEIFNFFGSRNLYFYSNTTNKLAKIIKVKSKYLPDRIAGIGKPNIDLDDMQMQSKYYIETGRYINFLYDSYRNVYYRIVKKPAEYLTIDGKQRSFDSFEYSIMILDSNFNISNEIDLAADTFDFHLMFVDRQGLWISLNNPNNKAVSEDEMKLVLFTVEKDE